MNAHLRLSVAILVSLLAHVIALLWVMQQVRMRLPDEHGLLQVFLPQYSHEHARHPFLQSAETAPPSGKNADAKHAQKSAGPAKATQETSSGRPASGRFYWQPPAVYRQNDMVNAMQQAQLAQQREAHRAAVMSGISNLAVQLRPVITASIVCTQQASNEIDCIPAPKHQERLLLEQFFNLALEARRLGVAENPVRMDFGPELRVSVSFLY
ncbi:hypothetical protein [Sideroxydans sp. CL21]|uniref:hypothetical protein n=1 Tax=Sideroxydans sp. CL21 TaxID=2600596 RepID=UPI0024BC0EA7|nr:hypothetical protein [Sideroxydans sp. CL21]